MSSMETGVKLHKKEVGKICGKKKINGKEPKIRKVK